MPPSGPPPAKGPFSFFFCFLVAGAGGGAASPFEQCRPAQHCELPVHGLSMPPQDVVPHVSSFSQNRPEQHEPAPPSQSWPDVPQPPLSAPPSLPQLGSGRPQLSTPGPLHPVRVQHWPFDPHSWPAAQLLTLHPTICPQATTTPVHSVPHALDGMVQHVV
jgi:hypothetical protein